MMMGPTKKKVMLASIVSFVIPVVIGGIFFVNYKKEKDDEIDSLKAQTVAEQEVYVFARDMVVGEIITSDDLIPTLAKEVSTPFDSYASGDISSLIGRKMRINAIERTIVAESMLIEENKEIPNIDERYQEFNMVVLPSDLQEGDYIDIRLAFPNGEDYIVVSGKEVKKVGTGATSNTIYLQIDEEEILRTTAAIIESYMSKGTKLYATKYVNPSEQLYEYKRVNFVEKFEVALKELVEKRQKLADEDPEEYVELYGSGDVVIGEATSGDSRGGNTSALSSILGVLGGSSVKVEAASVPTKEIANSIGLTEKETQDIRDALENDDQEVLDAYTDKLVTTRKNMVNTYPVPLNVAALIKENPNILETIKAKYNVEELTLKRLTMVNLAIYELNDEGKLEELEPLQRIEEELTKEIEAQKAERKEYLQNLLIDSGY